MRTSLLRSVALLATLHTTFAAPLVEHDILERDVATSSSKGNTSTTLGPIAAPVSNIVTTVTDPYHIMPKNNVSIYYGSNETSGNVNVALSLVKPAVVLEDVADIGNVDCSNSSMTITFSNSTVYQAAIKEWTAVEDDVVMITNHLGDCDATFERGFFVVKGISGNEDNSAVTASANRTDLSAIASIGEFTINKMPANSPDKRFTDAASDTYTTTDDLANDTSIYSDTYVSVVANDATFNTNVTFSGYLSYDFWSASLKSLYFDIDGTFSSNIELTADVTLAANKTFSYAPGQLTYDLIDVPGILQIGPGINFDVGAKLAATGTVELVTDLTFDLGKPTMHIDVVDESNTYTSGWDPTYSLTANLTESIEASIDPYADITVELVVNLLSGLVNLSTGITATPGFTNVFTVSAEETATLSGSDNSTSVSGGMVTSGCSSGLELNSTFTFDVKAFATEWWSQTVYSTSLPVFDECYTWL